MTAKPVILANELQWLREWSRDKRSLDLGPVQRLIAGRPQEHQLVARLLDAYDALCEECERADHLRVELESERGRCIGYQERIAELEKLVAELERSEEQLCDAWRDEHE